MAAGANMTCSTTSSVEIPRVRAWSAIWLSTRVCADIRRADGIDGDTVFAALQRRGAREADETVFGCDVGTLEGRSDPSVNGGDVDNASPPVGFHRAPDVFGQQEGCGEHYR